MAKKQKGSDIQEITGALPAAGDASNQAVLQRIVRRKEKLGKSLRQISLEAGLSSDYLRTSLRQRKLGPHGLKAVSVVLQTTPEWILRGEGPEEVGAHNGHGAAAPVAWTQRQPERDRQHALTTMEERMPLVTVINGDAWHKPEDAVLVQIGVRRVSPDNSGIAMTVESNDPRFAAPLVMDINLRTRDGSPISVDGIVIGLYRAE